MRTLRGHHLLCVHGFQGMGYSESFVEKMTEIVAFMRDDSTDGPIRVIAALDEACYACPHHGVDRCEADENSNEHVLAMDRRVLNHLQLEERGVYMKSELIERTKRTVEPDDLDVLCAGCSWLSYGVCKEGIRKLKNFSDKRD
ncbi:DUF1284 domain-containing protein [Anoxybacillus sp. CHMUD]|uniref:DUF1284 domain-containing protein n=1 Tax=Anoxybacillus sp. CHMUD TaxID=2508870 RepID=UPI0014914B47|nr:DUF1284 domain-containing protein [Anoxybacillus sp. CHMUD]NNU90196.1 DUF1284 domain-containing protein [Anoxybacillus sp. CHMUD]